MIYIMALIVIITLVVFMVVNFVIYLLVRNKRYDDGLDDVDLDIISRFDSEDDDLY